MRKPHGNNLAKNKRKVTTIIDQHLRSKSAFRASKIQFWGLEYFFLETGKVAMQNSLGTLPLKGVIKLNIFVSSRAQLLIVLNLRSEAMISLSLAILALE